MTRKFELTEIIRKREVAMKIGEAAKDGLLGLLMESNFKEINQNNKLKRMSVTLLDKRLLQFCFLGQWFCRASIKTGKHVEEKRFCKSLVI